jgi:hypothetical protein
MRSRLPPSSTLEELGELRPNSRRRVDSHSAVPSASLIWMTRDSKRQSRITLLGLSTGRRMTWTQSGREEEGEEGVSPPQMGEEGERDGG